ncbi:uncharacterized protein LOC135123231 [Zophobas morio]|uniref:uncharacterized protein LOC135123231 n=1 Tax=Zophobas morio TaxID=2755281 RepID=UPI003082F16A
MKIPTKEDFKTIANDYYNIWNFPHCLGAIDDANYRLTFIDVGAYGKQSDGGIFRESNLYHLLQSSSLNIPEEDSLPGTQIHMPYVLIGDEAYPLLENLLKPYAKNQLTLDAEYFNRRLSRARKTIECTFGILYSKWRLLSKGIETNENTADNIIKAICVLHNTILDREGFERHLSEITTLATPRGSNIRCSHIGRPTESAKNIRDTFKQFICHNRIAYTE